MAVKRTSAARTAKNSQLNDETNSQGRHVSFAEAFRFWVRLGFISFGGPAGQIAIMHRELVERRRWLSEERFLHALNYCMLLPGPEAQQLAIYIGWLLHRTWGGIVAGAFFVLPSIFVLLALSYIYAAHGNVPAVAGVLAGFKPIVVAIVVEAVIKIGGKALKRWAHFVIAAAAFISIYFLHIPFPVIVLAAGIVGLFGARHLPKVFGATPPPTKEADRKTEGTVNRQARITAREKRSPRLFERGRHGVFQVERVEKRRISRIRFVPAGGDESKPVTLSLLLAIFGVPSLIMKNVSTLESLPVSICL